MREEKVEELQMSSVKPGSQLAKNGDMNSTANTPCMKHADSGWQMCSKTDKCRKMKSAPIDCSANDKNGFK